MYCEELKKQIREIRNGDEPEWIKNDALIEIYTGDADMCDGCDMYETCFESDE